MEPAVPGHPGMTPPLVLALFAALVAGVVTSALVPVVARLAGAVRALDRPDERKRHAGEIPRLGGVAIFVGLGLAAGAGLLAGWKEWGTLIPRSEHAAFALGTGLVFLIGVLDDLYGVSPAKKFLVQFVAAWLVVQVGWSFGALNLPFVGEIDLGVWGGVVSMLWLVGVTNAINLIDGLDGLASGVVAIIAVSLLVYSFVQGNPGSVVLLASITGACVGFLRHNWAPARIYLGDSGSLTLGFLLAAISLHSSLKAQAAVAILVPVLALGLPVIDTLLVMAVRFFGGEGAPFARRFARMFRADRSHIHHLLGGLVAHRHGLVALLYGTAIVFCAAALAVALTGETALGLVLLAVEVAVVLAMRSWGLATQARRLAEEQRAEVKPRLERFERGEGAGEGEGAEAAEAADSTPPAP